VSYTKGMENHQVKSRWYYLFWGTMAVAVVSGQFYVGTGYRELAKQQRAFAEVIYSQQMGWGPCQEAIEMAANQKNRTGEFE
jgi:hypothetical protein